MHFRAIPTLIQKDIGFDGNGSPQKTIRFQATLDTQRHWQERGKGSLYFNKKSKLQDGREIDSLPCSLTIKQSDNTSATGLLTFVPSFEDSLRRSIEPDQLMMSISLPNQIFKELWVAICNDERIIFSGRVDDVSPSLGEPHIWDIEEKANQTKDIFGISYTVLTELNKDTSEKIDDIVNYNQDNKLFNKLIINDDPTASVCLYLHDLIIDDRLAGYFDGYTYDRSPMQIVNIVAKATYGYPSDKLDELKSFHPSYNEVRLYPVQRKLDFLKSHISGGNIIVYVPEHIYQPFIREIKGASEGATLKLNFKTHEKDEKTRIAFESLSVEYKKDLAPPAKLNPQYKTRASQADRIEKLLIILTFALFVIILILLFK